MNITVGTRFGYYEVVAPIGSGGMGEVYLAHDTRLGRRVALKVLPPRFTADERRVGRFQQEARAASALNHPNIITIYEIGQTEETHFIAAEYVEGQTVAKLVASGQMQMSEVLDIAIQAASAISAAHAAGIVHRDIKSENIMVRPDGYVKVLDFGLAKLTEVFPAGQNVDFEGATIPLVATSPGIIMGTVSYMSPEQARGFTVDARSDIFSLGVVLYEMVTGKLPFTGDSGSDVLAAILKQETPSLSRYTRDIPPELEWIVSRALEKAREARFQKADEMLSAMKRLKQQLEFRAEQERSDEQTLVGDEDEALASDGAKKKSGRRRSYDTNRLRRAARGSGFQYLLTKLSQYRREATFVFGVLVLAAAAGMYFWKERGATTVIDSIAVIPFASLNADPGTEALADGMTQGLITNLSRVPKLRVRSLASVLRYKAASPPDARVVGHELDVPVILTGRVSQRNNALTINIELVDSRDNTYIWGRQYERKLADLLALQEEITREVSQRLKLDLNAQELARFEAFQSYLRGRYFWNKRTAVDLKQGIDSFDRAIKLDAGFALAYAGLADSYNMLGSYGNLDPNEAFPKAREAAQRALQIDDTLAEAHASLAYVKHRYEWDWAGAEREFKRAIELDPNYAPARQWYSGFLAAMGRTSQGIVEARRGQELDPLSLIVNSQLAWVLYLGRRYDEALAQCQKIIALDDNFFPARRYAGLVYEQMGRYQEAIAALNKARNLGGSSPVILGALAHAEAVAGNHAEAKRLLDEIIAGAPTRRVSAYEVAVIYTGLGEKEKAFEWLEKAYTEHNEYLNYLLVDPRFDKLRKDARYDSLLRRIGLAPQQT